MLVTSWNPAAWKEDILDRICALCYCSSEISDEKRSTIQGRWRVIWVETQWKLSWYCWIFQIWSILAKHVRNFGNHRSGKQSYLSSTIYEEAFQLMTQRVRQEIISGLQKKEYYSVSVDWTPEISQSHVDQLILTVRYLCAGEPVERFLTFLPIHIHKALELSDTLLKYPKEIEIDLVIVVDSRMIMLVICQGITHHCKHA